MPSTAHGAPYPSGLMAPDGPAQLMALATWIDEHVTLIANDASDRDSRFGDIKAGQIVATNSTPFYVWLKVGSGNTWATLYNDTGWVTSGFAAPNPDFAVDATTMIRNRNGLVDFRYKLTYSGSSDLSGGSDGNISDTTLLRVPVGWEPSGRAVYGAGRATYTSGAVQMGVGGAMVLTDIHAGATITNGNYVSGSLLWLAG